MLSRMSLLYANNTNFCDELLNRYAFNLVLDFHSLGATSIKKQRSRKIVLRCDFQVELGSRISLIRLESKAGKKAKCIS